jgi:hypothetical protein
LNESRTAEAQRAASAAAEASSFSLICSMTLICSAIGMNWSGGIRPSVSSCHRASASSARSSPVARSVIGWKTFRRGSGGGGSRAFRG